MTDTENQVVKVGFGIKLIATFFYSGYLPGAPGTWTSGFTAIILFFIWPQFWVYQLIAIAAVYLLGVWVSGKAEERFGHDGRPIVIDEVMGQMVALFMAPQKFLPFFLAFVFFRFFDVVKPPPIKAWESYRKGWGVMADDLAAGFYAVCLVQLVLVFLEKWNIDYI
ncbi:MAG: phosphatidylglycerophosphatase A [Candidatus Zixiibacteriota bacterium]|nr:MAG: phosphatidylglycerophosphatase A [candidate division Zixibacteria bacterium]